MHRVLLVAVLLTWGLRSPELASALTATLITSNSLVHHTPGTDLRIGTADDGTVSGAIPPSSSGPNTHGAASFALLNAGGAPPDSSNFTYILFVDGTIQFTTNYAGSTAGDLVLNVTGGSLRSTAEFNYPTRGEATTTISTGTAHLDPMTGAATVQLGGTFAPSTASSFALANETLTAAPGKATIVLTSMLGSSGDTYVDTVLAPLVPQSATAVVLVEFTGTVQSAGCCTGFVTHGVLAAYTTDSLGCADVFPQLCPAGGTTTTTVAGCATIDTCRTSLGSTLPDPTTAQGKKEKTVAKKLVKRDAKVNTVLDKATTATGKKQQKLYAKARKLLAALLTAAEAANGKGMLGVPLAPLQTALNALLAAIPSS